MPRYTELVSSLPATVPFVGPETQERAMGRPFRARIGANESVFGPSPRAVAAMCGAAAEAWKYGDPENHDLKQTLAAHHGIPAASITVGEGIDGLLGNLVRQTVGPATPVVTSLGAYPTFSFHVTGFGGTLHQVPYRNDCENPSGLAAAAHETGAALVYLANPDNPMGTFVTAAEVLSLRDALPGDALLCLDEAYCDFAPPGALPPLDVTDTRMIRMRTFSKAHGMAGARIAYAIGHPDLIASFDRVRNHFGVSRIAQAGALAALQDTDWLARVVAEVEMARARICRIATENGLDTLPSATNFVTIDCGQDGAFARCVLRELVRDGVFVRMPSVAPLDRCIRVSAGRPADLDIFAEALPLALNRARNP